MTITERSGSLRLRPFLPLLLVLMYAAGSLAGADGCKVEKLKAGQRMPYCGDLHSLAAVNIRNAVLEKVAGGLDQPWAMEFIGPHELLVTELGGAFKRVDLSTGTVRAVSGAPEFPTGGKQLGLMDLVLHPDFADNGRIYFSHGVARGDPTDRLLSTGVSTALLREDRLEEVRQIFVAEPFLFPPAQFGGALEFGPDGYLYLAVGDRANKGAELHKGNTIGKIIRLTDTGAIPTDNPFVADPHAHHAIYATGVRNPQGLRFDIVTGVLYETEHGPMGGDEVNIILPGRDYGWPAVSYGMMYDTEPSGVATALAGYEEPLYFYLPSIATSPIEVYRGAMFPEWDGYLLVGALKEQFISLLAVKAGRVLSAQTILTELKDRVRDIKVGPDGALYVLIQRKGRVMRLSRDREDPALQQRVEREGERVYGYICASCHEVPGGTAPQVDDATYWQARRARPVDELYRAVRDGVGDMPPAGLCDNCTEQELREAVEALLARTETEDQ